MASLSPLGLAFYALVLLGAFAVRGVAGFGAVLVAVPLLAFVLPVTTAVSLASALALVASLQQVSRDWRLIAWRQFAIIFLYTMAGIGLGFYFIKEFDEHTLQRSLGAFLILYAVYTIWAGRRSLVLPTRWHGALAAGAGIAGGFCGALFGAGVGPIYVIYFNVLNLEREVFRVTMSTIMLLGGATRIVGYAGFGFYERSTIILLAIGAPLVLLGSWLGDRLVLRLDPRMFGSIVAVLVLLSGVALLVK